MGGLKQPKVAIVGAGLMGRWHGYYARRCGAAVVAVVDRDMAAAERLCTSMPAAQPYCDLSAMLRETSPSVLHVCTPSETHFRIAETALEAGVHLLVEKPLTTSFQESERLLEMAGRSGLQVCPVHQMAFQDGVLRAAAYLPSLGRSLHLEAVICSAGGGVETGASLDRLAGEVLPHPLSIITSLWPDMLQSGEWYAMRPAGGEIRAVLVRGQTSCSIIVSMSGRPTECSFQVRCSNGSVYLDLFHGFASVEPAHVSKSRKILHPFETSGRRFWSAALNLADRARRREPAYPGLRLLIARFYQAILLGQPAPISRGEILAVAQAREAILLTAGICLPQQSVT